jgi:SAM-dependent methyltransferase
MLDRSIDGDDARLYLENVINHGLREDTAWLIEVGRFPVGCCVLDAGCGSGTLVAALAGDKRFARSVIGVELSAELASHAGQAVTEAGGLVVQADILTWVPPDGWQPDTMVMSFLLHHTNNIGEHLQRAASLLPHGGRLYILDRVAVDDSALESFSLYWEQYYRAAHEWNEDTPRLATIEMLTEAAQQAGFDFVRRQVCPHDLRPGTKGFPKTLMEFWRHESGKTFPAVMVVSPAHNAYMDEICRQLALAGLPTSRRFPVNYSDELIRTIYERCPWREALLRFVNETCSERLAMALPITGNANVPDLLDRLARFKKTHRERWPQIEGTAGTDGMQAIILPFHVPEPYEAIQLVQALGLLAVVS